MTFPVGIHTLAQGPMQRWRGPAKFRLFPLIVAAMAALAGCATPSAPPPPRMPDEPPPVHIPESTWWQVDTGIGAVSLEAMAVARSYASGPMENWRRRALQRTEADFIPWYTGFWTQEWLSVKVAWYKMNAEEGSAQPEKRLTIYLQEQYQDRVLIPVAKEIDPNQVREQATKLYVQHLREELPGVARRYHIPAKQFDERLKGIPAIVLAAPAGRGASLYQLIHADPVTRLPAYTAMIAQVRKDAIDAQAEALGTGISPVAQQATDKLASKLAVSGGASVAAAVFGGIAGVAISLGSAGFGAATYNRELPKMETMLKKNLNAAVDEMWYRLMNHPVTGVMAGADHISAQIKGRVPTSLAQPVRLQPLPQEIPLPEPEEAPPDEEGGDQTGPEGAPD